MIDPVELQRIAVAALSAGGIVLFGAAYAICLALGRLKGLAILRPLSYVAYLALVAVTVLFAWAMNLTGSWAILTVVLLIGYFVAPRAIWRLSVATHETSEGRTTETEDE
ncbi:MAG: hypothetical protein F4089_07120 [Gammaproteobacteria bacterium]|nr:hypothetical protein [Gammaproteobacteria bacterium]MYJ74873.1 hypothetical protein [Gammaproteobacteria bacterium]